ncbi:MAG: efflux RND transporter periplasmic adaptor subunit [Syntrophobacteraceae bacterium]|jgi:cobalt-zinc-cadmium efflux system membrane fusion protein
MIPRVLLLVILIALYGCDKGEGYKAEGKKDILTCKVTSQKVRKYIDVTGTVQPDLDGGAKVASPVSGRVSRILVSIGEPVKKGTPLIVLKSSDVTETYANYLSTLSQLKQAERIYNLNKQLFAVGAVTKNDLLISQAAAEQQKALAEGIKKKLNLYGVASNTGRFPDDLTLASPMDGFAAEIQAHVGDRFDSSTPMMTIADPDKVVVVANMYDTNVSSIKAGQKVSFVTDVIPDTTFNGTVKYISHVEDADSKTVKVYIGVSDDVGLFKQNMFLKIRILGEEISRPVVPTTAIIYRESKFAVRVRHDDSFELKEIKPLEELPDRQMAIEGLQEGDEIACSAIEMEKP